MSPGLYLIPNSLVTTNPPTTGSRTGPPAGVTIPIGDTHGFCAALADAPNRIATKERAIGAKSMPTPASSAIGMRILFFTAATPGWPE